MDEMHELITVEAFERGLVADHAHVERLAAGRVSLTSTSPRPRWRAMMHERGGTPFNSGADAGMQGRVGNAAFSQKAPFPPQLRSRHADTVYG